MAINKTKKYVIPVAVTLEQRNGLLRLKAETGLSLAAIVRLAVKDYLGKK